MSEHAAFLRAIAEEPADDTARLVYADFLEETGEPDHVARAEFIRTQIEAHSLHPNHPRRAELEVRAEELFADHWAQWWLPVCDAVGLPRPSRDSSSFRERVARLFGRAPNRETLPYDPAYGTTLEVVQPRLQTTFRSVTFERGFPQSVSLLGQLREVREPSRRWVIAAPLTALHLHGTVGHEWQYIDGEHLRGVRELVLDNCAATAVTAIAESRNLPNLEELTLRPDRSNIAWAAEQYRAYAESSLPSRVRRLRVTVARAEEVDSLNGPHLANLVALNLNVPRDTFPGLYTRLASSLGVSAQLTGVRELTMTGDAASVGIDLISSLSGQLRSLSVTDVRVPLPDYNWLSRYRFPALMDVSLSAPKGIETVYAALSESPFVPQLQHLRLTGGRSATEVGWRGLLRLLNALDPEKLETLALDRAVRDVPEVWDELQERFPGRVSLV